MKPLERIYIRDAGEIYGTYHFSSLDSMLLLEEIRKPDLVFTFIRESNERYWPSAISRYESRIENRRHIHRYKVYRLAGLGSRMLLVVPPKKNKHMAEGYQQEKAFYMVINIRATEAG